MRKKQWMILCGTVLLFFTYSSSAYATEADIPSDTAAVVSEAENWEAAPASENETPADIQPEQGNAETVITEDPAGQGDTETVTPENPAGQENTETVTPENPTGQGNTETVTPENPAGQGGAEAVIPENPAGQGNTETVIPEDDDDDDDSGQENAQDGGSPEQTAEGEEVPEPVIPIATPEPLRTPRPVEERKSYGPDEFTSDNWRLILVNKQNSIPEDYTFQVDKIQGRMQCDERILDDLLDMLYAAKDDGVSLVVCSSYRDLDYQKMLFNRKIKRYMNRGMSYIEAYQLSGQAVTVPGTSEHEIGLALDIVCNSYQTLDAGFGDTKAGKWLAENSSRFGFVLRYPKGKEKITGIEYEPWHFRYVGKAAAPVMTEQGITLEEFWEEYVEDVSID